MIVNFFLKNLFITTFFIFIFWISLINPSLAIQEAKIVKRIDNKIITNIDIYREYDYLVALNNDLKKINKNEGLKIAEESLLREKVKLNEIEKFLSIDKFNNDNLIKKIIADFYKKLDIANLENFKLYLNEFDISLDEVENKIKIEILWNQLISSKFKNQIDIDISKLEKKIQNEDLNIENFIEYDLSEIVFQTSNKEEFDKKSKEIILSIQKDGFNISANKFSVSSTSKFGGKIGKVKESQLSKFIKDELKKIEIGEHTRPIKVANGFLILLINNKEKISKKINKEDLLDKMIEFERNKQFEKFSQIYYNKIKLNTMINEK
tara:strand:+ start:1489 stop:2454 length:966 start_codon:yes stop_codon:yes gene_type:complete